MRLSSSSSPSSYPVLRFNSSATFVSVLCRERSSPSAGCLGCVALPERLGCGWCPGVAACTTKEQCPVRLLKDIN